jgi:hypothetical protein
LVCERLVVEARDDVQVCMAKVGEQFQITV